jgi:hypothetical protein
VNVDPSISGVGCSGEDELMNLGELRRRVDDCIEPFLVRTVRCINEFLNSSEWSRWTLLMVRWVCRFDLVSNSKLILLFVLVVRSLQNEQMKSFVVMWLM